MGRRRGKGRQDVGIEKADGAFQRVDGGAEAVARPAHLRRQLGLMIPHERVVDNDEQEFPRFQRFEDAAGAGVGYHQLGGADVLRKNVKTAS